MLDLLLIIVGVALGSLLGTVLLVALAIKKPQFAKECIRQLVIIGKEVVEDIFDCL